VGFADNITARDTRSTTGGASQRAQDVDRRRLASPIGTEKGEKFSACDREVDPGDRSDVSVPLDKFVHFDCCRHRRALLVDRSLVEVYRPSLTG
jgi:hypothetical protein